MDSRPQEPTTPVRREALVVGATGVAGAAIVDQLLAVAASISRHPGHLVRLSGQ